MSVNHQPFNNKEDMVCLSDGEIWPCLTVSFRRNMMEEFIVGRFKIVWHRDGRRVQPYTVYGSDTKIVQFCRTLEEAVNYCKEHVRA